MTAIPSQRQSTAQHILGALEVLCQPGQVVELRVPRVDGKKRTDSGYFTDLKKLATNAATYEGRASGVYITLNPVEPALLARAENRVQEWAELSTSDDYIVRRRWLPIDIDPRVGGKKRPAGISSTDEEHAIAIEKTSAIRKWLSVAGWPDPIEADSGNGAALLYAIDLPNDDTSKMLIEACLKALASEFNDTQIDIDTSVYNAARIWKLYGTLAGKGDSTKERPHRRASLLHVPNEIKSVPLSLLQTLARRGQPKEQEQTKQKTRRGGIDAEAWLKSHQIDISSTKKEGDRAIHLLGECPFNANHGRSATVTQFSSGALAFRCLHDSCKTYDWRALREKYEPGIYDRHNGTIAPIAKEITAVITPESKSAVIVRTLADLGYTFRLNECSDTIEVNGARIDDIQHAIIMTTMRDRDFKNEKQIEQVWIAEAARHRYHLIKDYLNSCKWDGQPHIERLCRHFTCVDEPVIYESAESVPLVAVYLWRWLIGAVAKVLDQKQNLMLVLAGPQDIGKSQFARWLCSGIPQCHVEAPITVGDRDTEVRLMDHFIWEVAELDATTRKSDVAALKSFITRQTITARKAYGHHDTIKPACASLFGSINPGAGFLADETGNRRFYVATIETINWNYTDIPIDQIWAQAVSLYRQGEPWRLQPNESQQQREVNRDHEVDSLIDDWLQRYFYFDAEDSAMSAAEIVDHLRKQYDIRLSGSERAQAMEIGRAMIKFGIKKRQRDGRGAREYISIAPK